MKFEQTTAGLGATTAWGWSIRTRLLLLLRWLTLALVLVGIVSPALAAKTDSDNGDGTVIDPTSYRLPISSKSIVFVDSNVANYQSVIDSLTGPYEVIILDSTQDGLNQMTGYLNGRSGLDAIHVISHGSQGVLYLGNTGLDSRNLSAYEMQLDSIGSSLTQSGDILLYGCNVAQGDVGVQFIKALAKLVGADVQASIDVTGSVRFGGNDVLESQTGSIETVAVNLGGLSGALGLNRPPIFLNINGKVTSDLAPSGYPRNATLQADGKIVVLTTDSLRRFNNDGSLDTTFGGEGAVPTYMSNGAFSVALQADGKILVAGQAGGDSRADFALVRYKQDGSLDTTFSGDGVVTTDLGYLTNDRGASVTVQADGKILVAGATFKSDNLDFALVRYNPDGSLDTTFNGGGIVTTNLGSNAEEVNSVTVQVDGKILVAGFSAGDFALTRYNSNGSLDNTFSDDGIVTTYFFGSSYDAGRSVTVQADGKILVAGSSDRNLALARYNINGSLDTSFSGDGKVTHKLDVDAENSRDEGHSVTVQTDGKILVAGHHLYYTDNIAFIDFSLSRYNVDGSLDTTFGDEGVVITDFGRDDEGYSVALQTDGKILVVGKSQSTIAFARYNKDGSLDNSLGNANVNYIVLAAPVVMDKDLRVYDLYHFANAYKYASLTLARHGGAHGEDLFSGAGIVAGQANGNVVVSSQIIGEYTFINGTLTINFNSDLATQSRVDRLLQSLAYSNSSDRPAASVQIDWTFNDNNTGPQGSGGAMSVTGNTTVQIASTNLSYPLAPGVGWNLLGNSLNQALPMVPTFSDFASITTVWKWDPITRGWQFYAPSMTAEALQSYAASKGYGVLSAINPGEGYWVNSKTAVTFALQSGGAFSLDASELVMGWNLLAIGSALIPSAFNSGLSATPPAAGEVPINITTLWAWDNPQSKWYFYAPSLDASGGLAAYITGKGYLDFTQHSKSLGNGVGFWVNKP